ncbi:TPA: hypothetical protein MDU36_002537 [Klebsiella pneumoniae]|nr:hypothetical protein [Klebsiella michiganensis]HBR1743313.1 hypothetical protein [Klebsiella pneumoniae]HBR2668461.1 hypothetical protein [Klebsiella pneumoniae]HBS7689629.1 hypothetical protein [Klebsiella pneumoniae]HBV3479883.1 hypothetical protein [Klebsiella pneumoniae]
MPDGTSDDDLHVIASQILPSLHGDENTVTVDEDGVCWNNGECWYIEDLRFISEEDAAHLTRILGLSTI